jgi:hypothetical protein
MAELKLISSKDMDAPGRNDDVNTKKPKRSAKKGIGLRRSPKHPDPLRIHSPKPKKSIGKERNVH